MHTLTTLSPADFTITANRRPAGFHDLFPDFTLEDRLAVVIDRDDGGMRAALTILASVTAYYAQLCTQETGFWTYPDFYAIHIGRIRGLHAHIDIWPEHKEVVVPSGGEPLLTALNDRRVTRVLIPPGDRGSGTVLRESRDRARRQFRTVLEYGSSTEHLSVAGSSAAQELVRRARTAAVNPAATTTAEDLGQDCLARVDVEDLIPRLWGLVEDRRTSGMSEGYRHAHGVDAAVLSQHTSAV